MLFTEPRWFVPGSRCIKGTCSQSIRKLAVAAVSHATACGKARFHSTKGARDDLSPGPQSRRSAGRRASSFWLAFAARALMRGIVWQRSTVVRAGMRNACHCASRYEYCMRRRRSGSARASMLEAWNGRAPSRTDHVHDGHVRARYVIVTDNVCLRTSGRAINDTARRSQLTAARVVAQRLTPFHATSVPRTDSACMSTRRVSVRSHRHAASATRVGSTRERAAAASSCVRVCLRGLSHRSSCNV
jgi:hypothetical protein